MAERKNREIDEQQLIEALNLWNSFAKLSKYATYGTAMVLILLALYFIDFTAAR